MENIVGPQTQPNDMSSLFDVPELKPTVANCPPGAEERLKNAEHYLGINKSSLDVFQRLKAIEDKILYLESVSPEYFDFVVSTALHFFYNVLFWCNVTEGQMTEPERNVDKIRNFTAWLCIVEYFLVLDEKYVASSKS